MLMNRLTSQEIFDWCSIPWRELDGRDKKIKLAVRKDRREMMEEIGSLMADEVKEHNAQGLPTKWVLPAGPCDEYDGFIRRVNEEGIDLSLIHI